MKRGRRTQPAQRIVCLSAEAADWLWRLGAWEQVVGITAFFQPPPAAATRPRVGGFSTARVADIVRLKPDLVITFSDVQADVTAELLRRGLAVLATNQRTLAEIESTLKLLARVVDRVDCGEKLLSEFHCRLAPAPPGRRRPRVYFEEWHEPLITGIAWVSELIERAGGVDVFAEKRGARRASERVVLPETVRRADPEIIFASWCGKLVDRAAIAARPGWQRIAAVRTNRLHALPSEDILQPGVRLVAGYERLKELISPQRRYESTV